MRYEIVNHTSHKDVPVKEMYDLIGVQLFHFCWRWPGASHVVHDLMTQGFYLELVDDLPDEPGALGFHSIDQDGRPYSQNACNPSLQHGSDWLTGDLSVVGTVGHEALEATGNPIVNRWVDLSDTQEVPQEVCDGVEDSHYHHNGADLTNFLCPSWFNPFGVAPFDYLGVLDAPFSLTPGGYTIVRQSGDVSQAWGSDAPQWRKDLPHTRAKAFGVTNA